MRQRPVASDEPNIRTISRELASRRSQLVPAHLKGKSPSTQVLHLVSYRPVLRTVGACSDWASVTSPLQDSNPDCELSTTISVYTLAQAALSTLFLLDLFSLCEGGRGRRRRSDYLGATKDQQVNHSFTLSQTRSTSQRQLQMWRFAGTRMKGQTSWRLVTSHV